MNGQPVSHYFVQMPTSLIPTVTTDSRKDLVDFYKNGMSAAMPSSLGGEVVLKELSDDYLFLQTSENGSMQLKLLQVNDTLRVLALVQTVAAPLRDSRISFYSTLWLPLKTIGFPSFSLMDFLDMEKAKTLGIADRFNDVALRLFISYKFNQKTSGLVVHSSIREDIRPEILKDFEPVIKDSLVLVWNKDRFDLQNVAK